ncbi:MAG: T9SS type A sorting domain-containing protein [Candidatus Latescibacterota bacterium]
MRNGNLGWHYVNQIDTCIYVSYLSLNSGDNTITWDGKDKNGNNFLPNYTPYYIVAYDNVSPGLKATNLINSRRFAGANFLTHDEEGNVFAHPRFFDALPSTQSEPTHIVRNRWIIGADPDNKEYLESTKYITTGEAPGLALDPDDPTRYFFTQSILPNEVILQKWEWIPGGEAVLQTDWGNKGEMSYPSSEIPYRPPFGGPVSDGADQLFFPYLWPKEGTPATGSGIASVNIHDGTLLGKIDLSEWWSSSGSVFRPGFLDFSNEKLYVASPQSCIVQMINPYGEYVCWNNGYGDGIWDKALPPGIPEETWSCFDSYSPPNPASLSPDSNGFSLFPATGLNPASFGIFAPDGTGLGYFTIPGMTDGEVYGLHAVDSGSAFDGMYYSGIASDGDSTGVWYRGYDSFKGYISNPEPSWISVDSPRKGDVLEAGSVFNITWSIVWGGGRVNIFFSSDGGSHWDRIATGYYNPSGADVYPWTVPPVNSTNCLIRIDSYSENNNSSGFGFPPSGRFTIVGTSEILEESSEVPRPFVTAANRPNPFNPSTAIRYELGMPGKVSISVYNTLGQQVNRFNLGQKEKGAHEFHFDGSGLTSGIYFYRVETGYAEAAGKMVLVK